MLKFKKGDAVRVIDTEDTGIVINTWESEEDNEKICMVAGLGAFTAFLEEERLELVSMSKDEKMVNLLCDISQTTKESCETIQKLFDAVVPRCECCGEPMHLGPAPEEDTDCECDDEECDCKGDHEDDPEMN